MFIFAVGNKHKNKVAMKKALSTKAKEPVKLRTKRLANGNLSLYLDVYVDGKREYNFLKLYLIPEKTKADKLQNEETLRTANAIKAQMIVLLQNSEHGFSYSSKSKVNFIEFMEAQATGYEEKGSKAYATSIRNSIFHLKRYKGDAITLKHVDAAYLRGYIDFLNTSGNKYNKPLSAASKSLYFDVVVIALNKAVKEGILPYNPAHKIDYKDRPQQGEATKQYLTIEEVQALVKTHCKYEHLKQAFLFSCFCGLRYSDIKQLEWNKITDMGDGSKQVEINQQKTGEPLYLPLSVNALQWLPDKGNAKETDKVFKLPHVSTTEKYLDVWAREAGINKHVTFHVSRHTNATLMLTYGADIYTVSKLLGHTNVKTTQIYAKIVDENKKKAVNLIPQIKID